MMGIKLNAQAIIKNLQNMHENVESRESEVTSAH